MSNILYTYSYSEEIRYLNDKSCLKVSRLETDFNYSKYNLIDITLAIEYLFKYPENKIALQSIEDHLDENCIAIINEKQSEIALNMFPTIFYTTEKLSEKLPALKKIVMDKTIIHKRKLYYYNHEEKKRLYEYFNQNNIQFIDIIGLNIQEKVKNMNFSNEILVDITPLINNQDSDSFKNLINRLPWHNIKYMCEINNYNKELSMYFEKEIHISEIYMDFEPSDKTNESKIKKITEFDIEEFNTLEEDFKNKLIGHKTFKTNLIKKLKQFKILNELKLKKIFSVFLLGGSGIGKTEVARILNKSLNNKSQLIKINFGNYSSKDAINSLIGSPRGYIGSEDGELSLKLSKTHSGIILCDEFEKADAKIFSFFLELLEEGKFTDSQSREYDLNGYIIIFTSNLNKYEFSNNIAREFQTRLDLISEFEPLTLNEKEKFVEIELDKIKKTMKTNEKYKHINLSEFQIDFDLNEIDNLRDIQRKIYDQIINLVIETDK